MELAEIIGTSNQQLGRLENSERKLTIQWIRRISEALQCHPMELMPEDVAFSRRTQSIALIFEQLPSEEQERIFKICNALLEPASEQIPKARNE